METHGQLMYLYFVLGGFRTRSQVDSGLGSARHGRFIQSSKDGLGDLFKGNKLGDCVGNPACILASVFHVPWCKNKVAVIVLFEENGTKSRVEGTDTLIFQNLAESTNQAVCETRC